MTDRPTGLASYATNLLTTMARLRPDIQFRLVVPTRLSSSHPLLQQEWSEVIHVNAPALGPRRDAAYLGLWRKISPGDIYHCLSSDLPLAPLRTKRIVLTLHDMKYARRPDLLGEAGKLKGIYVSTSLRLGARRSKAIICVSEATRRDLQSWANLPSIASRSFVVPEAGGLDAIEAAPTTRLSGTPYFLCVAEHRPHKNIRELLTAFRLFVAANRETPHHMVFVGQHHGSFGAPLEASLAPELRARVHVIRDIGSSELKRLYAEAAATFLVSDYEGFGLPVIESMREGTPVVISHDPALVELVGDSRVQVDPRDHDRIARLMHAFATDPAFDEEQRSATRARAARFTWKAAALGTIKVYESMEALAK